MHLKRSAVLSVLTALALLSGVTGSSLVTAAPASQVEPGAGTWPTWLLTSGAQLRLPPPPGPADTQAELADLQTMAAQRDGATLDRIAYWDAGAPPYRWTQRTVKYVQDHNYVGNRAGRLLALMNVAIYDATVAAWDTKYAYNRPRPGDSLPGVAAIPTPASPSYPDEFAVAAGAASTVLTYIFPNDADLFSSWANEAANSRVEAGVAYPSDVVAGLALGRQVGDRSVEWGRSDGSDAVWTGSVPTEPGKWKGTNPIEPLAGTWKPWALTSGSQFRPGPPPDINSDQMARDLAEVRDYPRTNLTNLIASFWEYYGGRGGFEFWNDQASRAIYEHHLEGNPPAAARVYATADAAYADALIACWDAKYTYWAPRPAMVDPSITTVFVTPNHPSYPSAHSCISNSQATVLGRLFPGDAGRFTDLATQAGEARIMAGIHFRSDINAGTTLGQQVGEVVWARANATPSE
jgi:membrane-associated phospholipid phosphatase